MYAELIEKVARAIHGVDDMDYTKWKRLHEDVREHYRRMARAAIAALSATPQAAQVPEDAVTRLAIYLAEKDGHDPHALLWGEPRVEAWVRYKADASDYLAAAQAQGVGRG